MMKQHPNMLDDENKLQEMKTTERKRISKVDAKQCPIELKFQIQCDINPNRQNIKFEQFMIRFDILMQKHYE